MKKGLIFLLLIALLLTGTISFAEAAVVDTGLWEKRAYVDEFDLPTDEYYISNKEPIVGKFSNSATTDSELLTYIYIDKGQNYNDISVQFKLIEYGEYIVKNSFSKSISYDVAMMDTAGEKYYFTASMSSGSDKLIFSVKDAKTIVQLLCADGTVRFVFTETNNAINKYSIAFESSSDLARMLPAKNIRSFNNGMAAFWNITNKYGYVNTEGEIVIPCIYDTAYDFCEGIAPVCKDGQWGFIDKTGATVVPFGEYDMADRFYDGKAVVKKNDKYGYIDTTGTLILPCKYDGAKRFSEGYACVYSSEEKFCGYIDITGKQILATKSIGDNSYFQEGVALSYDFDKKLWGCIDINGNVIIPYEFKTIREFSDGLAYAQRKDTKGYIDKTGNFVIKTADPESSFTEGLAPVQDNTGKYGCIDTKGNETLPFKYDSLLNFNEGIACFITKGKNGFEDGKQGYIDKQGNVIIPCEYDASSYGEGYFALIKDGEISIINREDIQPDYKEAIAAEAKAHAAEAEKQKMLKEYTDKETIKAAQTALNAAGYDCGKPDGIAGKGTAGAVTKCQTDMGLNVTGTITHELLIALGVITE